MALFVPHSINVFAVYLLSGLFYNYFIAIAAGILPLIYVIADFLYILIPLFINCFATICLNFVAATSFFVCLPALSLTM